MFKAFWRAVAPAMVVLACWLGAAPQALAAGDARKGAAPAWVSDIAIPQPRPERSRQVTDGIYYLLVDRQVRPDPAGDVDYRRSAYKITDRGGLEEAGQLRVDFDPSFENLTFHRIRILRGGASLDGLTKAPIQVIQREEDLSNGVVTGRKTALLEIKDVRVGDIVDIAYSWNSRDRLMQGHYFGAQSTHWSSPAGLTRFRLLWPHGRALTLKHFAGAPEPKVTPGAPIDKYEWRIDDAEPVAGEANTPSWIDQWGRVAVSSMTSWAEVVAWALPLYERDNALPPGMTAELDRIAQETPLARDRVTRALRLVQDDVRYVSLSIGAGSFVPRSPQTVLASGYGDCKDKALLLSMMLRRLRIDAAPALTNTDRGRGLAGEPPSPNAFDHVIVQVRVDGKTYWIDPTRSQEGGRFPNLSAVTYGFALPIRKGQARLEVLPPETAPRPTVDVLERYVAPAKAGQPLTLEVTSTYSALEAETMRHELASRSPAQIEKDYLEFYAAMYPGLRVARPIALTDDRDANRLVVREAYELPADALAREGLNTAFPLRASAVDAYKDPAGGARRSPFLLPFPINKHHRIELVTPGRKPPAPKSYDIDGVGFRYALAVTRSGETLTLDHTLTGAKDLLTAEEVETHRQQVDQLKDAAYWELDLTSTQGGVIGGASATLWAIVLLGAALVIAAAVFGVRAGLRADAAYSDQGRYYPVALWKFILMDVATIGLYTLFWMWKSWRWAKAHGKPDIAPFWRAFFVLFWLYPLFEEANSKLGPKALPTWLGIAGAVAYFAWSLSWNLASNVPNLAIVAQLFGALSFLFVLPAVVAVNRANQADRTALVANSRITGLTLGALGAGALYWAIVLYGAVG